MSSRTIRIGFVGCGVVGKGALDILRAHAATIEKRLGATLVVEQIAVRDPKRERADVPWEILTSDPMEVARNPKVDIVVEVMGGIEPAERVLREAPLFRSCSRRWHPHHPSHRAVPRFR